MLLLYLLLNLPPLFILDLETQGLLNFPLLLLSLRKQDLLLVSPSENAPSRLKSQIESSLNFFPLLNRMT